MHIYVYNILYFQCIVYNVKCSIKSNLQSAYGYMVFTCFFMSVHKISHTRQVIEIHEHNYCGFFFFHHLKLHIFHLTFIIATITKKVKFIQIIRTEDVEMLLIFLSFIYVHNYVQNSFTSIHLRNNVRCGWGHDCSYWSFVKKDWIDQLKKTERWTFNRNPSILSYEIVDVWFHFGHLRKCFANKFITGECPFYTARNNRFNIPIDFQLLVWFTKNDLDQYYGHLSGMCYQIQKTFYFSVDLNPF